MNDQSGAKLSLPEPERWFPAHLVSITDWDGDLHTAATHRPGDWATAYEQTADAVAGVLSASVPIIGAAVLRHEAQRLAAELEGTPMPEAARAVAMLAAEWLTECADTWTGAVATGFTHNDGRPV